MSTHTYPQRTPTYQQDERSLGDLFSDLSQKAGLLVHQEVALAKVEMKEKAVAVGREMAIIVVGGFIGNAALLAFVAALVLGLAQVMEAWLAALLVGGVLAIVAGILIMMGINALKEIKPAPERTIATLKEDKEWLAQQMR